MHAVCYYEPHQFLSKKKMEREKLEMGLWYDANNDTELLKQRETQRNYAIF